MRLVLFLAMLVFAPEVSGEDGLAGLSEIDQADHGDTQVAWLVHDRPRLQAYVTPGNPIWDWMRDAFDYSADGEKLYWDPSPSPAVEIYGGETKFLRDKIIFVHIDKTIKEGPRAGVDRSAEELLNTAVFELNNARHWKETRTAAFEAFTGKISRDDFILAYAKSEFQSSQGTERFVTDVWQPFCLRWQIPSDERIWEEDRPATFEDWIKQFPPGAIYPWRVYGLEYDELRSRGSHH